MGHERVRLTAMSEFQPQARADASLERDTLVVRLGGDWRITGHRPAWQDTIRKQQPARVLLRADQLGVWDSSLALYLQTARTWSVARGATVSFEGIPAGAEKLADLLSKEPVPTL